jgi:hypothetical protein
MGVPPAKLHEKPAKANKWGTRSEHAAGFFDPVAARRRSLAKSHEKPSLCGAANPGCSRLSGGFFQAARESRRANRRGFSTLSPVAREIP